VCAARRGSRGSPAHRAERRRPGRGPREHALAVGAPAERCRCGRTRGSAGGARVLARRLSVRSRRSGRVREDPFRRRAERLLAAEEPVQVRLRLTERRIMGETSGEWGGGTRPFLVKERDVAAIFGFLPFELGAQRSRALALGGEQADEYLVAQRRGPTRTACEPGGERPFATRREAKQASQARAGGLIASHHEAATLELVQ